MGPLFGLPPEGLWVFLKEELKDLKAGIACSSRSKNTMAGIVQRPAKTVHAGGWEATCGKRPAPASARAVLAQDKLLLIMSLGNGAGMQPTAASSLCVHRTLH